MARVEYEAQLKPLPANKEELERCLADPEWRLFSGCLYKIMIKQDDEDESDVTILPFVPNRAQRRFIARLWHRNLILKARQMGFCVDPATRVLTAGLEWVPIGDIQPGTEVVAVDEHPPGGKGKSRRMRTATVEAVKTMQAERFRITFDDGREVVCTDRHPWLSRKAGDCAEWRSLSGAGNEVVGRLKVGTSVRWVTKPWDAPTFEDGWFGGMLDGEGSMAKANTSAGINVSQREGPVWERLVKYAAVRGYSACVEADQAERPSKHGKVPVPKLAFGRMDELFRLIGQTRPTRFINRRWWEGRELPGKRNGDVGWSTITKIEPLGAGPVVDMQTSTGTYIAEGFVSHNTTLIAIMWLDHALFNADQRCGIIAQDRDAAKVIFRDKVKFAYERLPEQIRERFPVAADNADELLFAHNNSSIRVATSMRSGTIHRLHVSEFGKICAKFPDKADEVVTGSIPAVPTTGVLVIESTAEGKTGQFAEMVDEAKKLHASKKLLTPKEYRFHFYAWWQEPKYRLADANVPISREEHEYFDTIEAACDCKIDRDQRAWYMATLRADFSGKEEKMWQEYPSTPEEAFQVSIEGNYYGKDMLEVRRRGGVTRIPVLEMPVYTFWDIGNSDGTAIWFMQSLRGEDRFIDYAEDHNQDLRHYARILQERGYLYAEHFLPHDADHKRLGDFNQSIKDQLQRLLPGQRFTVVPRITELSTGIYLTRKALKGVYLDEERAGKGIARIEGYRKKFSRADNRYLDDQPDKSNGCSEGADAFRQYAQAKENGQLNTGTPLAATYEPAPDPDWRT